MKKAIKKTCVVLLLFALLASQVAASYSETGTLNEGTSAISAAERYLSNWAYNSYMYADKNLTLGTVLDAEVDPAKLTLATSEFMALRNDADGQENNISVAVSKMQANIQFMIDKATYFSTIRQYNGLQRTDFNTDYVVQRVDVQGNFAVIEVLENISFQYVGAEDSSFSQKEHTVSLIKVDGEWIVANVETKYDWFASGHPLPAVFHTSFLTLSHAPSASAFGMIVISNRYNGLPAPQQIASPAEIVPFSIPTVQSSDNGYNIYLDFGHERQEMPCASRVRSTFRTKYSM